MSAIAESSIEVVISPTSSTLGNPTSTQMESVLGEPSLFQALFGSRIRESIKTLRNWGK